MKGVKELVGLVQSKLFCSLSLVVVMSAAGLFAPSADANLITNGSFEINGGIGQLAGGISDLTGWTVGSTVDSAPYPFALIVDASADTSGCPSVYSPPNLTIWGPGNGSNNGFTGSADGGYFLGVSGGYAATSVSQTISGLTVGTEYVLSYEWAAAQFSEAVSETEQGWQVMFNANIMSAPMGKEPAKGFGDWQTFTHSFTASLQHRPPGR